MALAAGVGAGGVVAGGEVVSVGSGLDVPLLTLLAPPSAPAPTPAPPPPGIK